MATQAEDPASVLEQFMHEAANLPAEINYMMEEIQAKDKEMQKFLTSINSKDTTLQKHVKANSSMQPHPKETEFADAVRKNYDLCSELQAQKIHLSEKACAMLERQVKKLDMKIRELQNDGQLADGPPLPSIFNKKPDAPRPFVDGPSSNLPLQAASVSALNTNAHRLNQQVAAAMRQGPPRQVSQFPVVSAPTQRSSAPATPAAALQQQRQQDRELSAGADSKRRKPNVPPGTLNMPAQPSSLRQSSLGPATPKAGTPTGGSRAGSIPRTLGQQGTANKKVGITKKGPAHPAVNKLKTKHTKHARLSSAGRKKGQSPSIRGGRGATAASEEDSVLSSGDPSDTDASQSRSRRGTKKSQAEDTEMADDEDIEDDDAEDDRRYCTCNQRSYGEMVACENDDCPYQWFHTGCLNMKKVPDEDEDWYCPTCRQKPEIIERMKQKQKQKMKK